MKLVIISRVFPPQTGGMERFVDGLSAWMAERGHDVLVLLPAGGPAPQAHHPAVRVLQGGSALERQAALRGADVVHLNGLTLRGFAEAVLAGRQPVVTHHGHQAICPSGVCWSAQGSCLLPPGGLGPCLNCSHQGAPVKALAAAHHVAPAAAKLNVCISRYLSERLALPRTEVILNPVTPAAFQVGRSEGRANRVLFAGRLVEEKGLDMLLRAVSQLDGVELDVAGDGPMRAVWERLASELGLSARVRFLGRLAQADLLELYGAAPLVCVPTLCPETFGYAVAEPMAVGCPVVATPFGGQRELLEGGRGFIASGATPAALAAAVAGALESPGARGKAAATARQYAMEHLTMAQAGTAYEAVFGRAAQGRS